MRGSLESIIKHMIKLNNHKSNISFPAIVVNTDNLADGFIDVKPLVNNMNSVTGETIEYPPIRNVQVLMPSSKSSSISFPIVQGDTVDLLFQSVDIVDFVNGEKEAHDPFGNGWGNLANVVALVGFTPYQESPFNPNNYSNDFNNQDLNIVHNKNTGLESSVNISASGSILQKAPNAVSVDSPLFDVKSDLLNANNAIITTGGDVVVKGQSLNQFMLDAPLKLKGSDGDRGWSPVLAVENRGQEDAVLRLTDWVGGEGDKPSEQGYIGSNGLVEDILDAINIRGARGKSGAELSADIIQDIVNSQFTVGAIMDLIQGQIDESALTKSLTSKIDKIEYNELAISQETQNRIQEILDANSRIDSKANQAEFINFQQDTSDEFGAQGEKLEGIIADYKPRYADATRYVNASRSTQWTYWKTLATENLATNERITNLQSSVADSNAQFIENLNTVATSTSATASKVTTLQTTVAGNTASIQTVNQVTDGLKAQSTTLLDVNGKVVGVGTYNDGKTGEFAVYADNFYVAPPVGGDDGLSQLIVRNTATTIDGVYVPAGLYTRNFYAPRASIDTIQIKDAAIKTAQIDNLAVTTGKIANLAVDTLQINDYAVTIPVTAYTEARLYFGTVYEFVEVQSITVPSSMGYTNVSVSGTYLWNNTAQSVPSSGGQSIEAQLYKDGVPFGGVIHVHYSQGVGGSPRLGGTFNIQRIVPQQLTDAVISVRLRAAYSSYVYERHMTAMTVRR